jgi:hypothetical protein
VLVAAVTIFLTGIPIAYYSAQHSIDMDVLTRAGGFGYLGSTITSVVHASFTPIFFALEPRARQSLSPHADPLRSGDAAIAEGPRRRPGVPGSGRADVAGGLTAVSWLR